MDIGTFIAGPIFIFLIVLCAKGLIWFLKETWNEPGIDIEKFKKRCRKNYQSWF